MLNNLIRNEDFLKPIEQRLKKIQDLFDTDFFCRFKQLQDQQLEKFQDLFNSDFPSNAKHSSFPKMNVYTTDDEFVVCAAVPGMTPEDVAVEVAQDNELVISGRTSKEYRETSSDDSFLVRELRNSQFKRRFKLPNNIQGDPQALLKDGVLTLRWKLVKDKPALISKKIEIKT